MNTTAQKSKTQNHSLVAKSNEHEKNRRQSQEKLADLLKLLKKGANLGGFKRSEVYDRY